MININQIICFTCNRYCVFKVSFTYWWMTSVDKLYHLHIDGWHQWTRWIIYILMDDISGQDESFTYWWMTSVDKMYHLHIDGWHQWTRCIIYILMDDISGQDELDLLTSVSLSCDCVFLLFMPPLIVLIVQDYWLDQLYFNALTLEWKFHNII